MTRVFKDTEKERGSPIHATRSGTLHVNAADLIRSPRVLAKIRQASRVIKKIRP